jgi:hypothetical protein
MARWTASEKWGEAPALDGQRDMLLALRLSEWLGPTARCCIDTGISEAALGCDAFVPQYPLKAHADTFENCSASRVLFVGQRVDPMGTKGFKCVPHQFSNGLLGVAFAS